MSLKSLWGRAVRFAVIIKKASICLWKVFVSLFDRDNWIVLYKYLNDYNNLTHKPVAAEALLSDSGYLREEIPKRLSRSGRKFLLVTHELSRTGAPQALLHLAASIRDEYDSLPFVISPVDGPMREEFEKIGCLVIIDRFVNSRHPSNHLPQWLLAAFDVVVANSVVLLNFLYYRGNICQRLVSWMHETESSFNKYMLKHYRNVLPYLRETPFTIWCGSVNNLSLAHVFGKEGEVLFYGVPDAVNGLVKENRPDKKTVFLLAGAIIERKGQEVFVNAVGNLPQAVRSKAIFRIVGSVEPTDEKYAKKVNDLASIFPEIIFTPSVPLDELFAIYRQSDVLVSASLDDPLPVVVTYGLMFGMPCLVTDAIGHAQALAGEDCLDVVPTNDAFALARRMEFFIEHPESIAEWKEKSRSAYERHFSMSGFRNNFRRLLDKVLEAPPAWTLHKASPTLPTNTICEETL